MPLRGVARHMNPSDRNDAQWNAAWGWVIREHEQPLDEAARAELVAWLKADPAHLEHYEEACRIWLAAALVPPLALEEDTPPTAPFPVD
jgi:ferric-dicitrate binding protein FerR (iron transport regulator)